MSKKRYLSQFVLIAAGLICFSSFVIAQNGATTVWSGVYTEAQATRGKELYAKNCASCHGEDLEGKAISDSSSPPALKGDRFTSNWADLTLDDLHTRMRTTMPPDSPGSLTSETYTDILTFVLKQNAFPAGMEELTSNADALKTIVIKKDK